MILNQIQTDDDHIWMNAASEGPLLKCAHEALEQAVAWKSKPYLLGDKWARVPTELKQSIGQLIGASSMDVILGTSASYGLFILANSYAWEPGDEVLVMENDFPTNILPWLALSDRGVVVRQLKPKKKVLTVAELHEALTEKTRWVCLSHIHSFSGCLLDIQEMAAAVRSAQAHLVVNVSQSLGNRPMNISQWDVDAVIGVGYKWLCGPYGTGFAWIAPEVRKHLSNRQPYWQAYLNEQTLQQNGPIELKHLTSARAFDISGTANFFNFVPLKTSIDFWLDQGLENVQEYNDSLVDQFLKEIDRDKYDILSPEDPTKRSHLMVVSCKNSAVNKGLFEALLQQGIHPAYWKNHIRFSPHAYNTSDQISQVVKLLNSK